MNLETLMIMRHELLLVVAILVVLIGEVSTRKNKSNIIHLAIGLFAIVTAVGFLPIETGKLFGGMYQTSNLVIAFKNILNIGTLIIILQAANWLRKPENEYHTSEFFLIIFSTLLGMQYMVSSGDFLMFYLGLETATIPLAALAAFDRHKTISAEAGVKLILSSALSSGILLFGLSLMYGINGSLYFANLATAITVSPLMTLAFIFFFAGMAFKISLVPFHLWTADVYEGAPINVTSFLSVISKGAAAFIFTGVLFTVFHSLMAMWQDLLYVIIILTITIGNLFAMRQRQMKRFLAFSSIAQAGFILLGIISGSQMGYATVVYFALIYIFSNLAAFGVVSVISDQTGLEKMDDYNGLYRTNPNLSLIMMLAMFSLAGIPPMAGFFGKFFLYTAAAEKGYYLLVFIAVVNTIISLYYYLLPIRAMFIEKNENPIAKIKTDYYGKIALVLCVLGIFATGLASTVWEYILSISFGI